MNTSDYLNLFVEQQKQILEEHEENKGDSWKTTPDHILVDSLFEEIREFSIKNDPDRELIDIANQCMLLWAKRKFFKDT